MYRNELPDSYISAWIRHHTEYQKGPPELTTDVIETLKNNRRRHSVLEKERLLLKAIERRTHFPGQSVGLKPELDYPLSWSANNEELDFLLRSLEQRQLVRLVASEHKSGRRVTILPKGWEYLDTIGDEPILHKQVFVAMSFSPKLRPAWEYGIAPAVRDAGYNPYRIDEQAHIDRIDAKIITEIHNSRFLVADVTEQKAGVYFEAGFALGLSRPVIWSVREDDLSKVHFDTRQYNHIVWQDEGELKEKLFWLVCAVVGKYR